MPKLTIDDIYEQQLKERVPDPILAKFVSRLNEKAELFLNAARRGDWLTNYESGLEICRITQQVRLEVGELRYLSRISRRRIAEILEAIVEVVVSPDQFVQNYPEANRSWGARALGNIIQRYEEAHEEDGARPDLPKKG